LCGFLLLSLGVLEQRTNYDWIDPDLAEVAAQAGQYLPSLIGAALIVLAIALSRRVNLAWAATIILLLTAAGVTLARGEPDWIPAVLALATLLVAPFRSAFYRHARLLSGPIGGSVAIPLFVLVGSVLALAAFERHVRWLDDNAFWEVILSPDVPNSLRASVALSVALGAIALWRLIRPGRVNWLPWSAQARENYAALGADPPSRADGFLWGEAERAGIVFRRIGRVMLALGDPAGADSDRVSAIWRLRDLAQQEGLDPAVWNAGPTLLKVYADLGLAAVPLGHDGLPVRSDSGAYGPDAPRRFLVCVAERDLPALLPLLREMERPALEGPAG
jgi:phosphatidylglycerol lysyltransferase